MNRLPKHILESVPFQYAADVFSGKITTGKRVLQAVERFYSWLETAEQDGYVLDYDAGIHAVNFFPTFLNHTVGKLSGKPFHLAPFQQFTIFNVFGWKDHTGKRRISTVYDKRAKKNGKTAEMAGLALYVMAFDGEQGAQVYIGATKEEQAKICWKQAKSFITSPVANRNLERMGFIVRQKEIFFPRTESVMMPLGGDSKTQDGINAHFFVIDEYHAHKDDGVKENLESSAVQRLQPIGYHITTAGTNIASVCKNYEDSVIDVLEGRKKDDHLWIMIHDLDPDDDWQDESNWFKANPLMGQGLDIDIIRREYTKAVNQPSKAPNFKTKHLNMWVDAPQIWIPNEIWMQNKVDKIPLEKFSQLSAYAAVDLSSTKDITAFVIVSEPDENDFRYIKPFFFCPKDSIDTRSREDRVPYRQWMDQNLLIATPGRTVDYNIVADYVQQYYREFNVNRVELDKWNASQFASNLIENGVNVSYFSQAITSISAPTKMFEKLVYDGKLKHDGNPILSWMLSGCVKIEDPNENIKIHKGQSNKGGKRIDGIIATIMCIGGSMSPDDDSNESVYNKREFFC